MPLLYRLLIVVALVTGLTLAALKWSRPEARLMARQKALVSAVSGRNWSKLERLLSPDYRDHWHADPEEALGTLAAVTSHFMALDVAMKGPDLELENKDRAVIRGRVELSGSGRGIAPAVIRRVEKLRESFVFTWEKTGRLPWQWSLVRVDQPELETLRAPALPVF